MKYSDFGKSAAASSTETQGMHMSLSMAYWSIVSNCFFSVIMCFIVWLMFWYMAFPCCMSRFDFRVPLGPLMQVDSQPWRLMLSRA